MPYETLISALNEHYTNACRMPSQKWNYFNQSLGALDYAHKNDVIDFGKQCELIAYITEHYQRIGEH